jgi:hypothetical protein
MSKQRGPLLLVTCAVVPVSGGSASIIQEPAIQHAPAFNGAADCRWNVHCDNWLGYWVPKQFGG